ncbi:MAG TPA: ABC transporter permease [Candidatus Bathyarchaeia archaeon]|nr:ABC transporter permease [Candidatus Bathyarchaeia archaeon]
MTKRPARVNWRTNFLAIVRYELIWNIRKKKFLGVLILAFVFATLVLFLSPILNYVNKVTTVADPNYVITTGIGIGSIGFFLFALVSVMNSISGEFESGSILPLLTKPVSRTTVYLGKVFAAFLTILGAFVLLIIYIAIGGSIIYGPQNNLYLLSVTLLGSLLSTLVWMGIVMAIGSVSKNSMLAALLGIGIWLGINIASGILAVFPSQAWVLTYAPGNGAMATLGALPANQTNLGALNSTSTGTDGIATNLITYILHPNQNVTYYKINLQDRQERVSLLSSEPISTTVSRSIAVAVIYIIVFNLIAWYALKRAQVAE